MYVTICKLKTALGLLGLGWAGLGWAGLGWAGLGWAGLGWAGLGWGRYTQSIKITDFFLCV
ncbi:TPA: hypothetical protein H4H93_000294 [Escherichia coli]|nr:hypothetical protein [Escherichia coli]TLH23162.1 hypothetical protein EWT43_09000 [Escherichia coli O25b:H4]TLI17362.1 hypothetical protein EWT47_09535 [Escherichia coli O25b:H4]HAG7808197.1 hypothetical protein [Escherichia coli]HAH4653402.1 hypothetical protein [Escherichia coli]